MLIYIPLLLLLTFPLYPSHHFPVSRPEIDHRIRLEENQVLKAKIKLLEAQLDKAPEEVIKKHSDEVRSTATDMLFVLSLVTEQDVRIEDIDFCMTHNADVNALDEDEMPPLFHAVQCNITLVRELIRAGADIDYATQTSLGYDTTALVLADKGRNVDTPAIAILLEAGATFPKAYRWLWDDRMTAHRQTLIDTIDETHLLPTILSVIVVNYAFGKPPKINPETEEEYYSDDEVDEVSKDSQ
ncbi:MAG: hypothetical protein ACHQVS_02535 [Candidatus Babeliales bacterium]